MNGYSGKEQGEGASCKGAHGNQFDGTVPHHDCGGDYMSIYICQNLLNHAFKQADFKITRVLSFAKCSR